jgi:hypothetical protein
METIMKNPTGIARQKVAPTVSVKARPGPTTARLPKPPL